MTEEQKVINAEQNSKELLRAFSRIPYALISKEVDGPASDVLGELDQICMYYKLYRLGASFVPEGSNGDYVPANLHFKLAASLINKEARFMLADPPSITIKAKGDAGQVSSSAKDELDNYNELVNAILTENNFDQALIKGAKDCFIAKRVACLVNFNEDDGVSVTFIPSTQFIYDTKDNNPNVLSKFVCFIVIKDSLQLSAKRIFKKKFVLEDNGVVYLEEIMYDGAGVELEEVTPYQETKLKTIPAAIFLNDGLTGDEDGESEIELLKSYESWYSKLANSDIDAERKSMNPIRYTIDMEPSSTKKLSSSAGSYWDLVSDQGNDNAHPAVGLLESSMSFSNSLSTTLDRLKTTSYDQLDIPNINMETMVGSITSGKALKAIYWPLIVRCKEKMKTWGPQLRNVVKIIIEGSLVYPNCITKYINKPLVPVDYEIEVEQNIPIQEDEAEEKQLDLAEVESKVMSRRAYMKKWRNLSDTEVDDELQQIAAERQIIEDSFSMPGM